MTTDDQWVLIRQAPKEPMYGLDMEIATIRLLSSEEEDRYESATKLLNSYAVGWAWNQAVAAVNDFIGIIRAAAEVANRSSFVVNAADVARANIALKQVSRLINNWIGGFLDENSNLTSLELDQLVPTLIDDLYIQVLRSLDTVEEDVVSVDIVQYMPLSFRVVLATNVRQTHDIKDSVDAVAFVHMCMNRLSELAECELIARQDSFNDAAKFLWGLHGECMYGASALIRESSLQSVITSKGNLDIQALPIGAINPIMNAVRSAKMAHKRRAQSRGTGNQKVEPLRAASVIELDSHVPAVAQAPQVVVSATTEERPLKPPIDLGMVVTEISNLPTDVERRWSQTLGEVLAQDNGRLKQKFMSLMMMIYRQIGVATDDDEPEARNTQIKEFPLRSFDDSVLDVDATEDQLKYQCMVAQLYALKLYTGSINAALDYPPNSMMELTTDNHESWWDSGAFARLKNLADVVVRISAHTQAVRNNEGEQEESSEFWPMYARFVSQSCDAGMVEAAIVYAIRSVRLIAQQNGITDDLMDADLTAIPLLHEARPAIPGLMEAANRILNGGKLSPATAWCMAFYWRDKLGVLIQRYYSSF